MKTDSVYQAGTEKVLFTDIFPPFIGKGDRKKP